MGSKNKTSKRDKKQVTDSSQVREDIGKKRGNSSKKDVVTDPRFSHVHYDPKFARARKQKTKVAIDSRFDQIFTDKNFSSSSAQVDKRGKPKKKDIENPLKHYYHLEDDEGRIKKVNEDLISQVEDDEANEESESEIENDEAHEESEIESENDESNKESESESDIDELKRLKGKVQDIESEDEEDVDDDDDEEEDAESDRSSADAADTTDSDNEEEVYSMEQDNFEQEENVPEIDKETNRLGVVNLDWNHVRAVDIFMLFTSFLPKGGKMLSVSVYPSEFGLKRMEEEAVRGPVGLFDDDAEKDDDSEEDDDNDDEIDDNKLRAYELSRLRYYYAVVECDTVATADYLYKTCDGLEFERSSNRLDLRFIPDSMEFKHPPRDVATEAPSNYEGMDFHSKVLQLSKIDLTWDEDEPQRSKSLKRKFNADQLADMELKEFLASDDSESESESDNDNDGDDDDAMEHKPEKKRRKQELYRALLQSGGDSEEDNDDNKGDMEVTFNTGLEELSKKHLEKKNKESETVWEAYLRKKKEKKKTKKNRSKNSSDDDESSGSDEEPRQEDADDFFIEEPTGKADKKHKKQKGAVDEAEAEAGRAELELLLANDESEINTGLKGYNMKTKKKSKGKKGNKNNSEEIEDDGKLPTAADYDDPRFSSLFTAPQFALDPTDPQFKRSAAYARQLAQKQGKTGREEKGAKQNKEVPEPTVVVPTVEKDPVKLEASSKKKDKLELSSLVKSLKMKSQNFQMSSKNKPPTNPKTRK